MWQVLWVSAPVTWVALRAESLAPTELSNPVQFPSSWNSMPASSLTMEFMVHAALNLLSTAIATPAGLTLCTPTSPSTWNLAGARLPGGAPGTLWKLVSVAGSTRRAHQELCVQSCPALCCYPGCVFHNTQQAHFPRVFQSSLGQGCFK